MTIAATDNEVKKLIDEHHVYGAEVVINALVRASKGEPYLNETALVQLIHSAFRREEEENAER